MAPPRRIRGKTAPEQSRFLEVPLEMQRDSIKRAFGFLDDASLEQFVARHKSLSRRRVGDIGRAEVSGGYDITEASDEETADLEAVDF